MNNATQSAVVFEAFGPAEAMEVQRQLALPEPGPGEVRIQVEAASVQWTDTMIRRGKYPGVRTAPPLTPGYDLVGVVHALGSGVSSVSIGDRVADLTTIGANARYVVRPSAGLTLVPAQLDAAEATSLILSWMTAYQALVRAASVSAGARVLVVGGNGAVGLAAIGLARSLGIEIWVTASERHHDALKDQGARVFPRDSWRDEVRTAGGVDVVIDGVGANNFADSFAALRKGGTVVAIGLSAIVNRGGGLPAMGWATLRLAMRNLWPNGKSGAFYSITDYRTKHDDHWAEDLAALFELLRDGDIHPQIAERLNLDQVADAHKRLEAGGLRGKLILDPWA